MQTYPIDGEVQVILLEKKFHHTQVTSHDSIVERREGGLEGGRGKIIMWRAEERSKYRGGERGQDQRDGERSTMCIDIGGGRYSRSERWRDV